MLLLGLRSARLESQHLTIRFKPLRKLVEELQARLPALNWALRLEVLLDHMVLLAAASLAVLSVVMPEKAL